MCYHVRHNAQVAIKYVLVDQLAPGAKEAMLGPTLTHPNVGGSGHAAAPWDCTSPDMIWILILIFSWGFMPGDHTMVHALRLPCIMPAMYVQVLQTFESRVLQVSERHFESGSSEGSKQAAASSSGDSDQASHASHITLAQLGAQASSGSPATASTPTTTTTTAGSGGAASGRAPAAESSPSIATSTHPGDITITALTITAANSSQAGAGGSGTGAGAGGAASPGGGMDQGGHALHVSDGQGDAAHNSNNSAQLGMLDSLEDLSAGLLKQLQLQDVSPTLTAHHRMVTPPWLPTVLNLLHAKPGEVSVLGPRCDPPWLSMDSGWRLEQNHACILDRKEGGWWVRESSRLP